MVWTLQVPENIAYDGLGTFVPGFSGIGGSSHGPRGAMVDEGFAFASYTPARKAASWYETARKPQVLHSKTIHEIGKAIANSSEVQQQAPNAKAIDWQKKLLLAHSMGGLGATEYALHAPGSVDAMMKLAACGYGHPTLAELAEDMPGGILGSSWHEILPSILRGYLPATKENLLDLIDYFKHVRVLLEGNSCLRHDTREDDADLRDGGIYIAYQAYEYDILVRADPSVAEHVDYHEIMPNAGHLAPIRKRRAVAHRVSEIILNR